MRALCILISRNSITSKAEKEQGIVLPSVDYNYVVDRAVGGGELSFDVNTRGIIRREAHSGVGNTNFATLGIDADSWRLTAQGEWQRTFVTSGGLLITPMLHGRGDIVSVDDRTWRSNFQAPMQPLDGGGTSFRGMVTAGLELRYPILFSTASATPRA
ncbi:MAG: LPS assembly protein LptD [Ahrensia sp.]|nr:LPS assembly protein LptD [Ahrensia sp.]